MKIRCQCADVLVKVSAAPNLLQLDLHGEVDSTATTATMADYALTFALKKVVAPKQSLMPGTAAAIPVRDG